MKDFIEHEGVVIDTVNAHVKVQILSVSACAGCHAKGACTAADLQEKVIDIFDDQNSYQPGQKVMLMGKKVLGVKAVALAYIYPLLLIMATLITTFSITNNEVVSGLISLGILVPYYIALTLFSDKLKKTFSFTIKQIIH